MHSYFTEWTPSENEIEMDKAEIREMIIKLYSNFIVYAKELCPTLINNPILLDWIKLAYIPT